MSVVMLLVFMYIDTAGGYVLNTEQVDFSTMTKCQEAREYILANPDSNKVVGEGSSITAIYCLKR